MEKQEFSNEVYDIYKQAAHELIEKDEIIYRKMLEKGKITKEQYDGLRLGKITVGLGYNDIAETIKENATIDSGIVTRPLPFKSPIEFSGSLYTNDSKNQYTLEKREDRTPYNGDNLYLHEDEIIELDNSNFTRKDLLRLNKLEAITKNNSIFLDTEVDDYVEDDSLLKELAKNYGLNKDTTRVVLHPNYAIIYDINGSNLRIADLLFNTRIKNDVQDMDIEERVAVQIKQALNQISKNKNITTMNLSQNQQEMFDKVKSISKELDKERGISHGK